MKISRFQQEQPVVDCLFAEELDQNAKEDVILAGNVDGVRQRVSVIPIVAELFFPLGKDLKPVANLVGRCHGDEFFQVRFHAAGISFHVVVSVAAVLQTVVHESEHLAQGVLQEGLLFGFDPEIDDGVLRRLELRAIALH